MEDAPSEVRMKLSIAVPTYNHVPAMFAYDLSQMHAYTVNTMPRDTSIGLAFLPGTYIHTARQELMEHYLGSGEDYVLWLDSDMRFPKETFSHLLQHDVPLVGINYAKKSFPSESVAIKTLGLGEGETPERLVPNLHPGEDAALVEVDAVGFGVLLMRMADFKNIPPLAQGPWFAQEYLPKTNQWRGEDVSFCRLIRKKLGIKILVDEALSMACAHIGEFEYTLAAISSPEEED